MANPEANPVTELKCPHCGNTKHERMEVLEEYTHIRELNGIVDGVLVLEGETSTGWDSGENERLSCKECGRDFPFPKDLRVDYT